MTSVRTALSRCPNLTWSPSRLGMFALGSGRRTPRNFECQFVSRLGQAVGEQRWE